jgi:TolB protein
MRSDGSGARRLLSTLNHPWQDRQYSPTWSPNGRRLIFTMAATDANPELYVIGVNGSGLKRLTRTAGSVDRLGDDTMPDWSTDGGTVVFVSNREGRSSDIWTMNPDGSRQRPLLRRNASDDWHPRLAAHGRTIAFTARPLPTGRPSVWLVGVDGSGATRLTTGSEPDWQNG